MKLIEPVKKHHHKVTVGFHADCHGDFRQNLMVPGVMTLSFCKIDFQNTPFTMGERIPELQFGDVIYKGVRPLGWTEKEPTVAMCSVEHMEEV